MRNGLVLSWVLAVASSLLGQAPPHARIDKELAAKSGGAMAPRSTDAEFFRRIHLDLAGVIPTATATRQFLSDSDSHKRAKTIDRLLASEDYGRRMRDVVTVWLLERRPGTVITDDDWSRFVEKSFAANKPWDQFVRELIAADGRDSETRPGIRFFIDGGRNNLNQMTLDVGRLFLGMNLQCAQCHNDPNVQEYLQADFYGILAYLRQSKLQNDKKQKSFFIETAAKDKVEFQSVFTNEKKSTGPRLPDGRELDVPVFKKGEEFAQPAKDDLPAIPKFQPRQLLAKDLTSPENRRFARNAVNRFWFMMMGRGLVQPLDLMHGDNPASHPELLEFLVDDFIAHKFDVKRLLREIALSEAYQRSSQLPEGVEADRVKPESYRVANAKGLSAEQIAYSLMQATGNLERIKSAPRPKDQKFTYKDYANGKVAAPDNLPDLMTVFVASFGSPAGTAEVEFTPSAGQALFLLNEKIVLGWLQPQKGNLMERVAAEPDAAKLAEELYLACLTRLPDADEVALVRDYLERHKMRRSEAIADVAWALLTSAEFRLNH
jgi:hypothetical protein